eukprot:5938205-Pyramimonas_sp.AAC.1
MLPLSTSLPDVDPSLRGVHVRSTYSPVVASSFGSFFVASWRCQGAVADRSSCWFTGVATFRSA